MKSLFLIVSFLFFSCSILKSEQPDLNTQQQVKLMSWEYYNRQTASLVTLANCGDTCYLRYSWYGKRPVFQKGMWLTILYDSVQKRKNVWVNAKIMINQ
jgi:hypothetical protein